MDTNLLAVISQYFFPLCGCLFTLMIMVFFLFMCFYFDIAQFIYLQHHAQVHLTKSTVVKAFSYSKGFLLSALTIWFLAYFELVLACNLRIYPIPHFLYAYRQFSYHRLLESIFFFFVTQSNSGTQSQSSLWHLVSSGSTSLC